VPETGACVGTALAVSFLGTFPVPEPDFPAEACPVAVGVEVSVPEAAALEASSPVVEVAFPTAVAVALPVTVAEAFPVAVAVAFLVAVALLATDDEVISVPDPFVLELAPPLPPFVDAEAAELAAPPLPGRGLPSAVTVK